MNLETVDLDDYLARNALPQFLTDLEKAWREDNEKDEKKEASDEYEA